MVKDTNKNIITKQAEEPSLLDKIKHKRHHLFCIKKLLKEKFIGLDNVIDEVIRNIEVWYVMPELITRPVIINLWGMTGVGKTDLVRTLVKHLEMSDKFLEIQLCNNGSATGNGNYSSLSSQINCSNLETKSPGILLLDEMQRFRTVSEEGKEIMDYKFQDVWMLLSDGKFSGSTEKDDILRVVFENFYWSVPEESTKKSKKKNNKDGYKQSYYSSRFLKKALRLQDSIEEIMKWNDDKKMQMAIDRLNSQETYDGDDFSKLLIFVSGNIDEAYSMSKSTSDSNKDADVWHAFTKKINIITIKDALEKRFKPEQISRLGNTHIIYTSLNRKSYEAIIKQRIDALAKNIEKNNEIKVDIDQSVYDFVYRNGVFPSQGVRPVFSTINSHIENSMPIFVLAAIEQNAKEMKILWKNNLLIAVGNNLYSQVDCEGQIDAIKEENDLNKMVSVSVHEAGHAIVYAKLFGISPTQIVSNLASDKSYGFIGTHMLVNDKEIIEKQIAVLHGGLCAERIVFGECVSDGGIGDITNITKFASMMIRDCGLGVWGSKIGDPNWNDGRYLNHNNSSVVNAAIEDISRKNEDIAKDIIINYKKLLIEVSDFMMNNGGKIAPEMFKKLCGKHGIEIDVKNPEETFTNNYQEMYKNFKDGLKV